MKRNIVLSIIALFFCTSFVNAQTDEEKYEKKVLLEEFTTEVCPNCPAGAALVRGLIENPDFTDRVIVATHHSGYYTDWLTTETDEALMWFYNSDYTFAPAMMFDRYPNFNDQYSHEPTPVGFVGDGYDMSKYAKRRLNKKAHVWIDITAEYDNDKTVTVHVKGDRTKVFCDTDPRIFVYITEDNVVAKNQAGASKGYKHSHVTRASNGNWGDQVVWNGDTYEYECKLTVEPEWNKDEMEIVAFISAFDNTDPSLCVVDNVRSIPFSATNGIEDAQMDSEAVSTEYFTIDGTKTNNLTNGMYIQKKTYSDGRQEVKKIYR